MDINWALRFKNPVTCVSLIVALITFVYECLAILGVTPGISESDLVNIVVVIASLIVGGGVVVDPTTAGISDSKEAMNYDSPKKEPVFETAEDAGLEEPADRSDDAPKYEEINEETAEG